jgi:predicted phage terminase large subunit-like protein
MKSILVGVMFPAWVWASNPERRFMYASYSEALAIRDGVKMRTIIESDLYRRLFQPTWTLRVDQNQKRKFENTATGYRYSIGVGGSATGEGGDFLVDDDPLNAMDANSEQVRESVNAWKSTVWPSRANDPKRHCRITVMQRLHEQDPTGHVLDSEKRQDPSLPKSQKLILQAKYDSNSKVKSDTILGVRDPRTKDGEVLWPERFNEVSLNALAAELDSTGLGQSHAQLQQDPKPASGGTFQRSWWKRYSAPPSPILEIVQFIDAAQKPGITNDYSVIATWARTPIAYYLLALWRDKVDMPTLEEITKNAYSTWKPTAVVIEDKAGGSSLIQYLLRNTEMPVLPFDPGQKDKEVRASAATPTVKAGKCFLPEMGEWVEDFITEHEKFPKGSNDDQVDTTSMMVEYFARRAMTEPRVRSL